MTRPPTGYRGKRLLDLALTAFALPIVLPIGAACAIAIRLTSPGPIVFTQLRTGRDGTRFRMYKFRTMVQDAEVLKAGLRNQSVLPPPDFKIPNDPRITRVGRFLRRTSLDELPQLLNVIKGEMSLVGPRPTSFEPSTYRSWHTERLEVMPGVSGLWQVRARHGSTFDQRLRLDIAYVRHMSLALDLQILWWTFASVFRGTGA
jgi:lipopolysaccharide/colanic/teichoic acid biosynthesis glycosyltransferase